MKLNRIISKFFALAAAVMVVAACSEDATEDGITGGGKPTPPVGDGAAYFNFEVDSQQQIGSAENYEYVVSIGGTIGLKDLSEATVSHEWQINDYDSEAVQFMLPDGSAIDPTSSDIAFDDDVMLQFNKSGDYVITLSNRYSESVTFTYPPEPAGTPKSVNAEQIGDSNYYLMEWDVNVKVYSTVYDNLKASFFTDAACTSAVTTNVTSPSTKSLYIKDTTPYVSSDERPTKYTWISTSHTYSPNADGKPADPNITFSEQDDTKGTIKVTFNENSVDEDIHIRMIAERAEGGAEKDFLPAIAATNYNGLPTVNVYYLETSDLKIAGIAPYDPNNVGQTNQIEITLDSTDTGLFSGDELTENVASVGNFSLAYTDNTNGGSGSLTATSWAIGSSATSLILTFNGDIYTNDSDIALTLSSDIDEFDLYSARPLTTTAVATAGADIAYERPNLFDPKYYDFNTMSDETLQDYWNYCNGTTESTALGTLILADDPHGNNETVLQVLSHNTTVGGHKSIRCINPLSTTTGTYNMSYKFTTTSTPDLVCANAATDFSMNIVPANTYCGNGFIIGGADLNQNTSNSGMPWLNIATSTTLGNASATVVHNDWQLVEKTNMDGVALTDYYLSLWWQYSKEGSFYVKDFKLERVNDRPAK